MSMLRIESFDHFTTAMAAKKGITIDNASYGYILAGAGRRGTQALHSNYGGLAKTTINVAGNAVSRTGVAGFAFRPAALGSNGMFFGVRESGILHLSVWLLATGDMQINRGQQSEVLATSVGRPINGSVYVFIEFAWTIHGTTGTFELRLNGVPLLSGINRPTQEGGTGVWDAVQFFGTGQDNSDVDDVYVANDLTFRGDHRIVCVVASSGNGTHTDWIPSIGTNHGDMVDDATPNTTDFNSAGVAGMRDTYNFPPVGVAGTVAGIQPCAFMTADVGGTRLIAPCTRPPGGPVYDDDAGIYMLGPDWQFYTVFQPTNPATVAAWTIAEIDASEFGVKVEG